jgi:phage shock protein B
MLPEYILTLGILSIVVGFPVLCVFVLKLNKQRNEQNSSQGSDMDKEETEILNDLHRGLVRMEKRIEALETILMEKRR